MLCMDLSEVDKVKRERGWVGAVCGGGLETRAHRDNGIRGKGGKASEEGRRWIDMVRAATAAKNDG